MDLKSRFTNKAWLLSFISALLLIVQLILAQMGIKIDNAYVMSIVNAVLTILTMLGVFMDPTTPGYSDKMR